MRRPAAIPAKHTMDDKEYKLIYLPEQNRLRITSETTTEGVLLDTFRRYDDVLDAMSDLRSLCTGSVTLKDVIDETYGKTND